MSVNRVFLIGLVAAQLSAPRDAGGDGLLTVAITDPARPDRPERIRVAVPSSLAAEAAALQLGQPVLVQGRLDTAAAALVVASAVTALGDPLPPPPADVSTGTHASPTPHERRGHWRRVAIGTHAERLVWVRSTVVGGGAGTS